MLKQYPCNPRELGKQLGELLDEDPAAFQSAAVTYLNSTPDPGAEQFLVWLLHKHNLLVELLLNARAATIDQALPIARAAKKHVDLIDVSLARRLKKAGEDQAGRILRLLAAVADNNRTLPLLVQIFRQHTRELRVKAAGIFARYCQNTLFTENAMADAEAEVRASAVEGLGLSGLNTVPEILSVAMTDPSALVRVHAALARFRLGDESAIEDLKDLSASGVENVQEQAIWALGETGDPDTAPFLKAVLECVSGDRATAVHRSLERIEASEGDPTAPYWRYRASRTQPLNLQVLQARRMGDYLAAKVFVNDSNGEALLDLEPDHFQFMANGAKLAATQFVTPQTRPALALALALDRSGSMSALDVRDMNLAVIRALNGKRPQDRAGLYKFSMEIEKASELTTRLSHLQAAIKQTHRGLKTASRLHDAIWHALTDLAGEDGYRVVAAIADGCDRGSERSAGEVIEQARSIAIPVHVVGFNTSEAEPLGEIAAACNGSYYNASGGRALTSALQDLLELLAGHYELQIPCDQAPSEPIRVEVGSPWGIGSAELVPLD